MGVQQEYETALIPPQAEGRAVEDVSDPGHAYAAYVFEAHKTHRDDIQAIICQAGELSYPVRYWWLSEAMELQGMPDRLVLCVNHPSNHESAGLDLYQALKAEGVSWGELKLADVAEYRQIGKPVGDEADILKADGSCLFPTLLTWKGQSVQMELQLTLADAGFRELPLPTRQQLEIILRRFGLILKMVVMAEANKSEDEEEATLLNMLYQHMASLLETVAIVTDGEENPPF